MPLKRHSFSSFCLASINILLLVVLVASSLPAHATTFPCTTSSLIQSAQNGLLSSASTWVGGSVPTDGNCVVIRHHVTLNRDWGTEGGIGLGWIRIENGGLLDADCASPHTIYFGSTGTNPTGSGRSVNPGADATMFGLFVSYGTVSFSCAQPNNISITSADENHPWYIHHQSGDYSGCTAIANGVCNGLPAYHGAVLNLEHATLSHMGTAVTYFNGIDWDMTGGRIPTNTLTVSYNWIKDLYGIAAAGSNAQSNSWSITYNWFDTPRPSTTRGLIYLAALPINWLVTDNTLTNSVTSSYLLVAPYNGIGIQVLRNAVLGSSQIPFAIVDILPEGGYGNAVNSNLCVNPEPAQGARISCIMIGGGNGDWSTTASYNVIQGGHSGISQIGSSAFNPTFGYNWISQWKEDSNGQGTIITRTS